MNALTRTPGFLAAAVHDQLNADKKVIVAKYMRTIDISPTSWTGVKLLIHMKDPEWCFP